jgi:membrane-associated phospholipid phosphatase
MSNVVHTPTLSPAGAPRPRWLVRLIRVALVAAGLAAWFGTQQWIGARPDPGGRIGDALLEWTSPIHSHLTANPRHADLLLVVSTLVIDLLGVFLLGRAILGPTIRPFLSLLILFGLRQVCQALCALPPPDGMIWRHPGFPTLLVTYGVSNDLFFSGHTGIAVLGAIELASFRCRWLALLGLAIAALEITAVIVLRAHWTMDVFAGAVSALLASSLAGKAAPTLDRWLGRGPATESPNEPVR